MLESKIIGDAPYGIFVVDKNDNFIQFNTAMEAICGLSANEMIGKNLLTDIPNATIEGECKISEKFNAAKLSLKKICHKDLPIISFMGILSYQTITFSPLLDEDGIYDGMIVYVDEVSDEFSRKKTLFDDLHRARQLSSFYSKDVPVVAFRWSAENGWPVEMVSDNISQYGYSVEDFTSGCLLYGDIIHPDDLERVASYANELESGLGKSLFNEYRILDVSGNPIWVNEISVLELDENGNPSHYNGVLIDVNDRKIAETELKESKARIDSIFKSAPIGLCIISNRIFEEVNDYFCEMLGYSREEIVGKSTHVIHPSNEVHDYVGEVKYSLLVDHGIGKVESQLLCKDGTIIDVILNSRLIHPDFISKGVTCTILDITDMNNAKRKLIKDAEELEKLNQIKDMFSDIIRHDLLGPAGIVRGYTEFLGDIEVDNTKLQLLHAIEVSNEKIIELIEIAAKYEQINSCGDIDFHKCNIVKMFQDIVASQRLAIKSRGMSVNLLSEGPCYSIANPIISEVFVNLLSNAIKYSPENDTIVIEFHNAGKFWKVTVTDRGDGVSDTDKGYVFERFKRADKKGIKGTGLGLAIVKRIIELHNGEYGVMDNPEGKGSVFWITLKKADVN
jgi:PAS domain S-box-containing protein